MTKKLCLRVSNFLLLTLPKEFLQYIILYLDPFSFYALSITCTTMAKWSRAVLNAEKIPTRMISGDTKLNLALMYPTPKKMFSITRIWRASLGNSRSTMGTANILSIGFAQYGVCPFCMSPCYGRFVSGVFGHLKCVQGLERTRKNKKNYYSNSLGLMPMGKTCAVGLTEKIDANLVNQDFWLLQMKMQKLQIKEAAILRLFKDESKRKIELIGSRSKHDFRFFLRKRMHDKVTYGARDVSEAFLILTELYNGLLSFDKWVHKYYVVSRYFLRTARFWIYPKYFKDKERFAKDAENSTTLLSSDVKRRSAFLTIFSVSRLVIWKKRFIKNYYIPLGAGFLLAKSNFERKC
jgi:hypothetical protein